MSIEKEIRKKIKKAFFCPRKETERSRFNKELPEFIDKAKFLEEKLKPGEKLPVGVEKNELFSSTPYAIYLELHKKGEKPERVLVLNCLGGISYQFKYFQGP